jgi:hypothetical protein
MKKTQAENAVARVNKVCRDLAEGSALLKQGTPPTPAITAELLDHAVMELGDVLRVLRDEVAAKARDYRVTVQHGADQPPIREAYASSVTAIRVAKQGHGAGATVAQVRRASDGVVIFDGPAGIELETKEW